MPTPKEFDDPNGTCSGILNGCKKLGFAAPSYHPAKLTVSGLEPASPPAGPWAGALSRRTGARRRVALDSGIRRSPRAMWPRARRWGTARRWWVCWTGWPTTRSSAGTSPTASPSTCQRGEQAQDLLRHDCEHTHTHRLCGSSAARSAGALGLTAGLAAPLLCAGTGRTVSWRRAATRAGRRTPPPSSPGQSEPHTLRRTRGCGVSRLGWLCRERATTTLRRVRNRSLALVPPGTWMRRRRRLTWWRTPGRRTWPAWRRAAARWAGRAACSPRRRRRRPRRPGRSPRRSRSSTAGCVLCGVWGRGQAAAAGH